jgi:hypothetical protein
MLNGLLSLARHGLAAYALATGAACQADPGAGLSPAAASGERIYRSGILADGKALIGTRIDGVQAVGAKAACINCHRASGMGGTEGNVWIPPIAGSILTVPGQRMTERTPRTASSLSRLAYPSSTRQAYSAESFARAMVTGKRAGGDEMGYLMPRYGLDEQSLLQLMAYLNTLKVGQAQGVDDRALHLATIVTDDAPVAERDATLAIISACIDERSPRGLQIPGGPRPWQHHVWRLGPDPARWQQELARHQRTQPVFAIISGISGGAWTPIHDYCEREAIPCVFPNTASVDAERASHWSFYFSQGVSLEAAALAQHLADNAPAGGWRRIVQHVGDGEPARLGAAALEHGLRDHGVTAQLEQRRYHAAVNARASDAMLGEDDVLVLWLSPAELRDFSRRTMPPRHGKIVFSGELGGLDDAPVEAAWRRRAQMLYPYERAERRSQRIVLNTNSWMSQHGLVPESGLLRLQGNTYSACEMTTRALQIMRARYSREYFLELIETADEGAIATAFPRFTLGPSQRHGSGGAYLMSYSSVGSAHWAPVGDWIVPRK